jgi:hypothetical protein
MSGLPGGVTEGAEMSLKRVILSGAIGQYGVKRSYTEQAEPQLSFSRMVAETGPDDAPF